MVSRHEVSDPAGGWVSQQGVDELAGVWVGDRNGRSFKSVITFESIAVFITISGPT